MPSIFVSYRRTDAPAHAGRIYDRLVERFGKENVYRDLDSTAPGADFAEVIDHTIAKCDALVAVIGRNSSLATRHWSRRRQMDDSRDWVRREIAAALERNIRVIPILVEGAQMPSADELPRDIQMLTRRHAVELSETAWTAQINQLIDSLAAPPSPIESTGRALAPLSEAPHRPPRRRAASRRLRTAATALIACVLAVGIAIALVGGGDNDKSRGALKERAGPVATEQDASGLLSAREYRLRMIGICTEHLRDAQRIKHAEPNRPVFGVTLQLETRTTDKLKSLRPPPGLEPDHRRVLALWGRRLSLLGYYWDRYQRERHNPAFIREFQHGLKRVDSLSLEIQQRFVALGVTPECDIFNY
jgi:hypothetical protein